jgi:PPOX class probable F420-dependent enzyme
MPRVPVPPEVAALLAKPYLAVVATVRPDGSPHTATTWYEWEDGRVLLNMADTRRRLENMRIEPRAALTVLSDGDTYDHVSLLGRIVSIEPDPELHDIDRLARRYTGEPFGNRNQPRFSAWLEAERWHAWPLVPENS